MPNASSSSVSPHRRAALLLLAAWVFLGHAPPARAVGFEPRTALSVDRFEVMLGLGQWALGGGNVAVRGNFGRIALEHSHGQGVHLSALEGLRNGSEKAAGADIHETWTTGLAVGYLVTDHLRPLVELKANRYELAGGDRNTTLRYTTFTIGPGVFYEIPLWKGLFLQPSLRWWPTVDGTLPAGATLARADGARVVIQSHASGVFPNVNVGWTF